MKLIREQTNAVLAARVTKLEARIEADYYPGYDGHVARNADRDELDAIKLEQTLRETEAKYGFGIGAAQA